MASLTRFSKSARLPGSCTQWPPAQPHQINQTKRASPCSWAKPLRTEKGVPNRNATLPSCHSICCRYSSSGGGLGVAAAYLARHSLLRSSTSSSGPAPGRAERHLPLLLRPLLAKKSRAGTVPERCPPIRKRRSSLKFSSVCPEPVLVK